MSTSNAAFISWRGPAIQVVGIGIESEFEALPEGHRCAIEDATVIIGGERHLALLPSTEAELRAFPSPLSGLTELLREHLGQAVVILASGDPLYFGIGDWLGRHLPATALVFHPNLSSVQAAFARLGLPWQDAKVVSLHGRPLTGLFGRLRGGRRYALLTDPVNHPAAIAAALCDWGQGGARCWVLEALGLERDSVRSFRVDELAAIETPFHPLNVMVLETRRGGLYEFPGIPDDEFAIESDIDATRDTAAKQGHGGAMISKREVRLMVLSLLQPAAGEVGWDLGAGCGSVAIEWARWNRLGRVYAVEKDCLRLACLKTNREHFGVNANLEVIGGTAPGIIADLPTPDAIFVGGGGRDLPAILDTAWAALRPGGRLVAAAITEPSRHALQAFGDDAEWTQIAVSRAATLGGQLLLRPKLPVLLMKREKPGGE